MLNVGLTRPFIILYHPVAQQLLENVTDSTALHSTRLSARDAGKEAESVTSYYQLIIYPCDLPNTQWSMKFAHGLEIIFTALQYTAIYITWSHFELKDFMTNFRNSKLF
jgi:hypothetical protein